MRNRCQDWVCQEDREQECLIDEKITVCDYAGQNERNENCQIIGLPIARCRMTDFSMLCWGIDGSDIGKTKNKKQKENEHVVERQGCATAWKNRCIPLTGEGMRT